MSQTENFLLFMDNMEPRRVGRDGGRHQVNTSGPLTGYFIKGAASLYKVAHICYVHTNFIYIFWEEETGSI